MVSNERFAATVMRLAGLVPPPSFRHGDFADAFDRDGPPEDEEVFFEHYGAYWGVHPFYAIRTRRHKYVRYFGPDDCEEMYDLEADPMELVNVASDAAFAEVRAGLSRRADEWWKETGGREFEYYESDAFRNNEHNAWEADR